MEQFLGILNILRRVRTDDAELTFADVHVAMRALRLTALNKDLPSITSAQGRALLAAIEGLQQVLLAWAKDAQSDLNFSFVGPRMLVDLWQRRANPLKVNDNASLEAAMLCKILENWLENHHLHRYVIQMRQTTMTGRSAIMNELLSGKRTQSSSGGA